MICPAPLFSASIRSWAILSCGANGSGFTPRFDGGGLSARSLITVGSAATATATTIRSVSAGTALIGSITARARPSVAFLGGLPIPAFEGVPEVVLLMGSLGFGRSGRRGLFVRGIVEGEIVCHRFRVAADRSGADLINDRVIVLGHIDLGRGQRRRACCGDFLIVVFVFEGVEQTDPKTAVVIVARDEQPGHGLALFHRWSGAELPHGLLGHRLQFVRRLRHWRSSPRELLFSMFFEARRLRRDHGSERPKIQTLQIIRVVQRPTGRKVNPKKLLCQRLGRRIAARTGGIRLVHNL